MRYFQDGHNIRDFAPVAPVSVLQQLKNAGLLGAYNLILAHNVLEKPTEFMKLFKRNIGTVIVDNSVIELGHPIPAAEIAHAVSIIAEAVHTAGITSDVVAVLPDVLLDAGETVQVAMQAIDEFKKEGLDSFMFVPQGKDAIEIIRCAEKFRNIMEIKWIGVARNFTPILGSRETITKTLQSIFPKANFHMLGFSRDTCDDILCTRLPGVTGIDSSMPLRLTKPVSFLSEFPKRGDWWKEDMNLSPIMLDNIKTVRSWLGVPTA